jgi:hypothetical protein
VRHIDLATNTNAIVALEAPVEGVQQPSALGTPTAPLSADNVPVAGSITPMQQSFLEQVTKKIGYVLPAPRINKRRAKGPPPGSQPQCSRRLAGLPVGQGQPGLSRPKKEVMMALGFAQAQEQISQQNLDRYSKLFLQPLPPPSNSVACSALQVGSARGVLSCLCSGRNVQFFPWIRLIFSFGMFEA